MRRRTQPQGPPDFPDHVELCGSGLPPGHWLAFESDLRRVMGFPTPKSEDLVRYVFFQALTSCGIKLEQFAFEYPHPVHDRARVDTVIVDKHCQPVVAIEVKYHRSNKSGANLPRPQLAGMLVHDVARLATFTPLAAERVLLYVTDHEMDHYYRNPANGLTWVTGLGPGQSTVIDNTHIGNLSATFQQAVGPWPGPVRVTVLGATDDLEGHTMRLYRIDDPEP